jgi:ABC-type glycerol-3-phosphate transport system substrate-binding protein
VRKLLLALPVLLALVAGLVACGGEPSGAEAGGAAGITAAPAGSGDSDAILAKAYRERAADLEVEGQGAVVRLLPDDEDGSRHQRFIIRLDSRQTLLVAHNIDVAPRILGLQVGDTVAFRGEYEWSEEGGTIHWTHRDPAGDHAGGWLRHGERTYQ